jgi:biopolymer transport protein ExbB
MDVPNFLTLAVTAAAGAPATPTATAAAPQNLFQYIALGGPITIVLVVVSIAAVALIIANAIILRLKYLAPERIREDLEKLLREGRTDDAIAYAKEPGNDRFLALIIARALDKVKRSRFGMLEFKAALEQAGTAEADRLDRVTNGIGMAAAVGPMLGLLGTVIGMIGAFGALSAKEGAERSRELAQFMSHALIATAAGLIVAIPCTIAFALYRKKFERVVNEVGEIAERLAAVVEAPSAGVAASGAAPGAAARPLPPRPAGFPSMPPARPATTGVAGGSSQ